jgi:hypothetical protein
MTEILDKILSIIQNVDEEDPIPSILEIQRVIIKKLIKEGKTQ